MVVSNIFFLLTIGDHSTYELKDIFNKQKYEISLDTGLVALTCIFKILSGALLIFWGRTGVKTFRPITREFCKHSCSSSSLPISQSIVADTQPKSEGIRLFSRKVIKILVVYLALFIITVLVTRAFMVKAATNYIDFRY